MVVEKKSRGSGTAPTRAPMMAERTAMVPATAA
jgi:hypothetical protein